MKPHYTIPFFITHKGCPFTCIFCNQRKISGQSSSIKVKAIQSTIRRYLKTIDAERSVVEVGFFGGSFTGLPILMQKRYLGQVQPFLRKGIIKGLRLSTRPDYINQNILDLLKQHNVSRIELGVQSMSDSVLAESKRGHTREHVRHASRLIIKNGIDLGHQIMVGLPKSTLRAELLTAKQVITLGASEVRIYPVIIIKGTALENLFKKKLYNPLTETAAIKRCAKLITVFNKHHVKVIRCGLHPSPGLISRRDIVAGPFHPAFRQKVESFIYYEALKKYLDNISRPDRISNIMYNPSDAPYAIGYARINAKLTEKLTKRHGVFKQLASVKKRHLMIVFTNGRKKTLPIQ